MQSNTSLRTDACVSGGRCVCGRCSRRGRPRAPHLQLQRVNSATCLRPPYEMSGYWCTAKVRRQYALRDVR
eukprot:542922-Rhodomonas_salina.1